MRRAATSRLRINPGFGHGHSRKTNTGGEQSKHGIWHEQLAEALARAARYGLTVSGLHMHIGSGTDLEHLSQVCAAMEQAAGVVGPSVASISAGGGLPTPYRPGEATVDLAAYFALWNAAPSRLEDQFGHAVTLEIEPGRYLVAESGYLVTEIRAVKRQGDNLFYLLDAGFNNLARPILYGAYHPMSIVPADGNLHRAGAGGDGGRAVVRVGRYFHPGGRRFRVYPPSAAGGVGEWLVIECAGAYGFAMGSNYNSRPLAAEVLLEDGQAAPDPPPANLRGPDPRARRIDRRKTPIVDAIPSPSGRGQGEEALSRLRLSSAVAEERVASNRGRFPICPAGRGW